MTLGACPIPAYGSRQAAFGYRDAGRCYFGRGPRRPGVAPTQWW